MLEPIQLKLLYQEIYDVVCFEDLAHLRQRHASAFEMLQQHHRPEFQPDQRLIFYTNHDPEQAFLDHLQRAAARIDISNWFLLVVCPFDIRQRLAVANQRFGHDDVVISSEVRDIRGTLPFEPKNFAQHHCLCPLPFMKILVNADGSTKPCCKYSHSTGNLQQASVQEIFCNDEHVALRQLMLDGQAPAGCAVCFDNERKGTVSLRQHSLIKYQDLLDREFVDSPRPVLMDLIPSNICNFACRICEPASSSRIAAEELRFGDKDQQANTRQQLQILSEPATKQIILDNLLDINDVQDLHVMGGEPFLWPRLTELMQHWIQTGQARDLRLEFNTNGSVFPPAIMQDVEQHFRACEVLLSIDNIGDRFQLERGGTWSDILDNIQRFAAARSHKIMVKLAPTVNIQNVLYLDQLIDLCEQWGLDGIVWHYLEQPEFFCIDHAPASLAQVVTARYTHSTDPELRAIAQRMHSEQPRSADQFVRRMDELDRRRDQSWRYTHRELAQALQVCVPDL